MLENILLQAGTSNELQNIYFVVKIAKTYNIK